MRHILFLLLLIPFCANAQPNTSTQGAPTTLITNRGSLKVDTTFTIPFRDTTSWMGTYGNITIRPQDNKLYVRRSGSWQPIPTVGSGSAGAITWGDTAFVVATKSNLRDTAIALNSYINVRVKYSDTALMLDKYWNQGDFTMSDIAKWNDAHNNKITGAAFTRIGNDRILTLTKQVGSPLTASYVDTAIQYINSVAAQRVRYGDSITVFVTPAQLAAAILAADYIGVGSIVVDQINRKIYHGLSGVMAGTYTKVSVNSEGHTILGTALEVGDVPNLPISHIDLLQPALDDLSEKIVIHRAEYLDSIQNHRIALGQKLNISDSGSIYVTHSMLNDSMQAVAFDSTYVYFQVNQRVKYIDSGTVYVTPTMLDDAAFDTTNIYSQLLLRVKYDDTALMLANYWNTGDFTSTNVSNWNTAYNKKVNSIVFSGTTTKTATLTLQDGTTLTGTFADLNTTYTGSNGIGLSGTVFYADTNIVQSKYRSDTARINTYAAINTKENSFSKGNIIAGTNTNISGTLTNRLVGAGDITISSVQPNLAGYVQFSDTLTRIATKSNLRDTAAALRTTINTKLNISDTSSMLSNYLTLINARVKYTDTAAMLLGYQTLINARVKYSDTSAMLAAYQTALNNRVRYSDTASMLQNYTPKARTLTINGVTYDLSANRTWTIPAMDTTTIYANINQRVKYSDTAAMLATYLSLINNRVKYTDTSAMLAGYNSLINQRVKYTDTNAMLAAYNTAILARVRYVDTATMLAGYTPKIRTLTINGTTYDLSANRTWNIAAFDTTNVYNQLNQRVKYTDTSGMLANYLTAIGQRLKYTDTATMLTAYAIAINARVKYTDTAAMLSAYLSAIALKENLSNKSTSTSLGTSNTLYPTQNAVKTYVDALGTSVSSTYIPLSQKGANNGVAPLDAGGKVDFQYLPATLMIYKGMWNPITNTPTLANGVGVSGWVYKASDTGTVNFGAGNITFDKGDFAIYNGTAWERSGNSDLVQSVNGQQGVVSLTTTNMPEGTNLYYTDARARNAISVTGNGSYNPTSGIITVNSSSTPSGSAGGDLTGTYPNPTIAADVVTNTKLSNMAGNTIKGRLSTTGDPQDLTATQVRTLINVANGATANQTDAYLLARANHTGTQAQSTVTSLTTDLAGKQNNSDTNTVDATRWWVTNQNYLTSFSEVDPLYTASIPSQMMNKADVPSSANFDTYQTTGIYGVPNDGTAASITNIPIAYAGFLEVVNSGLFIYQTYTCYRVFGASNDKWFRNYYGGAWSAWKRVLTSLDAAGYLTTETDPTVPSHVKAITTTNISNWNTAYGWGSHSGLYVPLARTLTINGVTQDLSANRTFTIPSTDSTVFATRYYTGQQYPLKNGTGATGTWSIGISGNAATVTNGVYTNGSYANPPWLTALAWSKITGAPAFLTSEVDGSVTNELQTVSKSGNNVTLSNGGGTFSVADADSSISNELQTVSKAGSTVTLSNGGGSFTDDNTTYSNGTGLSLSSNVFSVIYGTASSTAAQGNDSRINNGQTAFGWGNHSGLYAPIAHVGSGGTAHADVTTTVDGFMIAADKVKLDGIATGANNYVHPNSGVTAGTYNNVTVNAQGHVTTASNASYLTANQSITVTASGDATGSGSGSTSISLPLQIAAGVIVNADINSSAGITLSKLAAMTANRVVLSDASGFLTPSSVTNTTLSYLDATSSIQTQLNNKAPASGSANYIRNGTTLQTADAWISGSFRSNGQLLGGNIVSYTGAGNGNDFFAFGEDGTRIQQFVGYWGLITATSAAHGLKVGGLTISNSYSDVSPANGLYVKGNIQSGTVTSGMLKSVGGVISQATPYVDYMPSQPYKSVRVTSNYTVANDVAVVICAGNFTLTLPNPALWEGRRIVFNNKATSGTYANGISGYNVYNLDGSTIEYGPGAATLFPSEIVAIGGNWYLLR